LDFLDHKLRSGEKLNSKSALSLHHRLKRQRICSIAVGDRMFLEMQDFHFAQIKSLLTKFRLNFAQI